MDEVEDKEEEGGPGEKDEDGDSFTTAAIMSPLCPAQAAFTTIKD